MDDPVLNVLRRGFTVPVRDPLWGHIYLTEGLAALTESAPFTRLSRIFQLGPAYTVYPGATHTRASHSLGVYYLARRLLINLYEKGASWISARGALSFITAALLHDLGHFPYAHSLKELGLLDHEALSARLILSEPLKTLVARAGADPAFTAAIIDKGKEGGGKKGGKAGGAKDTELRFYRKLLSGVLDPDKLDYLNRDARYCGVPYGAQDVDFIYSRLFPHPERGVEIDSRGIPSVESVLFSKYLMYRTVYWHRQVRSATAMIKKALSAALAARVIAPEDLYNLDDEGLFALMASRQKKFPLCGLAAKVREGAVYAEADSWVFDEETHAGLIPLEARGACETALEKAAGIKVSGGKGRGLIIIDVPEPVSFETDLFVRDENTRFGESSSAFKESVVGAFARSLRTVRVFCEQGVDIPKTAISQRGILQNY